MATEPMKTLTLNGQTFEITDAQARATLQQIVAGLPTVDEQMRDARPWNVASVGWKPAETAFQGGYSAVAEGDGTTTNLLYDKVGRLFASDIVTRYNELRASVLSADNINAEFERFMSTIPPHVYAEDYASTTGGGAFTSIPLKDTNNILQIRQFVVDRLAYVDSQILS